LSAGQSLERATAAVVLVHGRGSTARDILLLTDELARPDFVYLAPQARGNSWYPLSFLAPIARNEPGLSSGLAVVGHVVGHVAAVGIPPERTMLLGFSQGACLVLEFAARHARRYGAIVGLSGGLIGPNGGSRDYPGSLDGTPVFLGCSDPDLHIPRDRVIYSADVLERLGGNVTRRLYPNMGHTVNEDELEFIRELMASLVT
jgi:predicted esterase